MRAASELTVPACVILSLVQKTPTTIVVVRHGATEWSESLRHTSRTDLPLTEDGRNEAKKLPERLREWDFTLVLTSPRQRAQETARLAGLGEQAQVDDNLCELDYGDDEGRTTAEIREERPGWTVWDGSKNGETLDHAGERADHVIERAVAAGGAVALFGHGHELRILIARWLGLPAVGGRYFTLATATVTVLGYEREQHVLTRLNA